MRTAPLLALAACFAAALAASNISVHDLCYQACAVSATGQGTACEPSSAGRSLFAGEGLTSARTTGLLGSGTPGRAQTATCASHHPRAARPCPHDPPLRPTLHPRQDAPPQQTRTQGLARVAALPLTLALWHRVHGRHPHPAAGLLVRRRV
jgi:hypothetical protein